MSTPLSEVELQQKLLQKYKTDPVLRHNAFFDTRLWSKQVEILNSVRDFKKTVVKSGNTVGKTMIAADVMHDFLTINQPSKVITTAPTWVQVQDVLWKEIAKLYRTSKIKWGAELLKTEVKFSDEWFAMGISTNEVHRFQGFHSPNLLVIIDEASGVTPEIWEAVESLHPSRVLAIGNPLDDSGDFYNCFSSPYWNKISISCEECVQWQEKNGRIPGLTTRQWISERADEWGPKSHQYAAHVLGEFPIQSQDALISRKWVDDAYKRILDEKEEDEVKIESCDVATKHGSNETVTGFRYGHTTKQLKIYRNIPTTSTANILTADYTKNKALFAVVDSDGVGEGVSDILIERNIPVVEFHGGYGQKSMDETKFRNLRTQFFWVVARKFEKGLYDLHLLPPDIFELLKNQLCSIRVKAPDSSGRMQIETKEDMMARGIKSPDLADVYMMGEYGYYMANMSEMQPYSYR